MRKGLRCDIVRREEQDCSNGGISSRYRRVTLVGDDIQGPFEVRPDAPAVKLVRRKIAGRDYVHAEPADEPTKPGHTSYMMGGTFIWVSDSRFPGTYPIPLHDRTESWETYDALSRD